MQSNRPNSSTAESTTAWTSASLHTSVCRNRTLFPSSLARALPSASRMSATITLAPSVANRRTVASPIPLAPPVMTTVLPSSRFDMAPSLFAQSSPPTSLASRQDTLLRFLNGRAEQVSSDGWRINEGGGSRIRAVFGYVCDQTFRFAIKRRVRIEVRTLSAQITPPSPSVNCRIHSLLRNVCATREYDLFSQRSIGSEQAFPCSLPPCVGPQSA